MISMSCRRWRIKTVPLSQVSKQEMVISLIIVGTCGTLFAIVVATHNLVSGMSCFIAVLLAIMFRWLSWTTRH
jgi:hypothetical protein